jgi:hypothetical protein
MAKEPLGEVDSSEAIVIILGKIVVVKQVGFIAGEQALNGGMDPIPFSQKCQIAFIALL